MRQNASHDVALAVADLHSGTGEKVHNSRRDQGVSTFLQLRHLPAEHKHTAHELQHDVTHAGKTKHSPS